MTESRPEMIEEFSRLLIAERRRIFGFIFSLVHDRTHAEDVFQDVSAVLWRKFESFEPGTDFGAWAMCVARLTVLNWRRRQQKLPLSLPQETLDSMADDAVALLSASDPERQEALSHCLSQLPPKFRELIRSRYDREMSVEKIADSENRTPRAIYLRLEKIYALLLSCMERRRDEFRIIPSES